MNPDDVGEESSVDEQTSEKTGELTGDQTGPVLEESSAGLPDEPGDGPVDAPGDEPVDAPGDEPGDGPVDGRTRVQRLEEEGDVAADYLEELLDIADLDGDLDLDVEGDRAVVSIGGADLSMLVGSGGEVLDALQELTRLAVYRETGERSRLMLDVGGYRADKRASLEKLAAELVERVKQSGSPESLEPMSAFERKVVHDAVKSGGLVSSSEGVEPRRYVVVQPV